jgi:hypothetical protein
MNAEGMRDWHKVSNSLRTNGKYVGLSIGAKLTYRTLLEVAKDHDTGGFFESAAQVKAMLPGELMKYVPELLKANGLIHAVDGGLQIHDFETWQRYADPASRDRQRKRRDRARQQVDNPVDNTDDGGTGNGRVTDKSRTSSRARVRSDSDIDIDIDNGITKERPSYPREQPEVSDDVPDEPTVSKTHPLVHYQATTKRFPSPKLQEILLKKARDHGETLWASCVEAAWRDDPTTDRLIERAEAIVLERIILRDQQRVAAQVERDARMIREQHELEDRLRAEGMTDEDAAARRQAISDFAAGFDLQEGKT